MTATSKPLDLAQFEGHTPGPWYQAHMDQCSINATHAEGHAVGVATATSHHANRGQNAGLLAAAPALLSECKRQREEIKVLREALEAIQARITGQFDMPALNAYGPLTTYSQDDCLKIARAALKVSP